MRSFRKRLLKPVESSGDHRDGYARLFLNRAERSFSKDSSRASLPLTIRMIQGEVLRIAKSCRIHCLV